MVNSSLLKHKYKVKQKKSFSYFPYQKKPIGLPRSRHKQVQLHDFVNVALHKTIPRNIATARFQKSCYNIYLLKGKKRCLSRLSTKRLYDSKMRTNHCEFSLPLHWKSWLTKKFPS